MKCLDETTLMELSLPGARATTPNERDHLRACSTCAAELAEQTQLSCCLNELADPEPPADFVASACCRYVAEREQRQSRMLASLIMGGLATGLLVVPLLLWTTLVSAGPLAVGASELLKNILIIGQLVKVFLRLPLVPAVVAAASAAATLIIATGIAQLARSPRLANSSAIERVKLTSPAFEAA